MSKRTYCLLIATLVVTGLLSHSGAIAGDSILSATPQAASIAIPQYRIAFTAPSPNWKQASHTGEASPVCIHFRHTTLQIDFVLTADRADQAARPDPSKLLPGTLALAIGDGERINVDIAEAFTVSGVAGLRVNFTSRKHGEMYRGFCWVGVSGDMIYSTRFIVPQRGAPLLRSMSQSVLEMISLSPDRAAASTKVPPLSQPLTAAASESPFNDTPPSLRPIAPTTTPTRLVAPTPGKQDIRLTSPLGYGFAAPAYGWRNCPDIAAQAPDINAAFSNNYTQFAIVLATPTFGTSFDARTFTQAMLSRYQLTLDRLTTSEQFASPGVTGCTGSFTRVLENQSKLYYQFRALVGKDRAVAVFAWSSSPLSQEELTRFTNTLTLIPSVDAPADIDRLTMAQRIASASMLTRTGVALCANQQREKALPLFSLATRLHGSMTVYHENLIDAAMMLRSWDEAEKAAERALTLFPIPQFVARKAEVLAAKGDVDAALPLYQKAFADDLEDDRLLFAYLDLLLAKKQAATGVPLAEKCLARSPSVRLAVTLAWLYHDSTNTGKAIALLKTWRRSNPHDLTIVTGLLGILGETTRYQELLDAAQEAIQGGHATATVLYYQAQAQMGLKLYSEAKTTLEKALALEPQSERLQHALHIAATLAGEGDRRGLSVNVPPVSIPESLLVRPSDEFTSRLQGYDAGYLHHITAISFRPREHLRTTEYYGMMALNQEGLERVNEISIEFEPLREDICINSVEIRDARNNLIRQGIPPDVHITDKPGEMANTARILHIPLAGIVPGHAAYVVVTRQYQRPPATMEFSDNYLSNSLPSQRTAVLFRGKESDIRHSESLCSAQVLPDEGLLWQANWPVVWQYEPEADLPGSYLPRVTIADSTSNWTEEARSYLQRLRDYIAPSPQAAEIARGLTTGLVTPQQKIDAILAYLQTQYSYRAIEFGPRARIPQPVERIIANRYGDCKDHAMMTFQLLRACDIPAQLALVRSHDSIVPALPSLDQFNHMICYARIGEKDCFFDTTDKYGDLTMGNPAHLAGRSVLILDSDSPRFIHIPQLASDDSLIECVRTAQLSTNGDVDVEETLSLKGSWASTYRAYIRSAEPSQRRRLIRDFLTNAAPGLELRSARVESLEQPSQPLVLHLRYGIRRHFVAIGNQLVGTVPSIFEHVVLTRESVEQRQSPFVIRHGQTLHSSITLKIPDGFDVKDLLPCPEVKTPYCHGSNQLRKDAGQVTADFRVNIVPGDHPAAAYDDYRKALQQSLDACAAPLLIAPNPSPREQGR